MLTAKTADGRYGLLRRAALLKAMKKRSGCIAAPFYIGNYYISMLDAVRGKGSTSLILAMPVTYITMRSNPRP